MRLTALAVCLLACLTACTKPDPSPKRYTDAKYLFSFIPPDGWKMTIRSTDACLTSVEAFHGDCRFYVCVSERPEDFLPTTSDFANTELVKTYVQEKLKGYNVRCRPSLIDGRRTYDAIYLRNVADDAGKVRLQLVRQTFLARGRLLYTLTSYTFGKSEQVLKDVSTSCDAPIVRSMTTFHLRPIPRHESTGDAAGGQEK